jgi:hypothetical protein
MISIVEWHEFSDTLNNHLLFVAAYSVHVILWRRWFPVPV